MKKMKEQTLYFIITVLAVLLLTITFVGYQSTGHITGYSFFGDLFNRIMGIPTLETQDICFPNTYYIDYVDGNDANNGTCTTSAWKHAPGDSNATGLAASTSLIAGDTMLFKGGVHYNGTIEVKWSGSSGNPITYDGNSAGTWGTGRAVIDGQGEQLGIDANVFAFYSPSHYNGPVLPRTGQNYIVINNFEITNFRYIYDAIVGQQPLVIYFDGQGTDVEIKNNYLHQIKKRAVAVNTNKEAILSDADLLTTVSVGNLTLTDTNEDFTPYAGVVNHQATHSIVIGWSRSDYDSAFGYLGPLNGSTHTVAIYKDIGLTQPGWDYFDEDYNPTGRSGYFYWIYNLQNGSHIGSGGVAIEVDGYNNTKIHDNIIKETRIGIVTVDTVPSGSYNTQVYNNDISLICWGIVPVAGAGGLRNLLISNNTLHDFAYYGMFDWGWHVDGIFIFTNAGPDVPVSNATIRDNYYYGNIGGATALLYISGDINNVKIYNNVFASSAGPGYQIRLGGASTYLSMYNFTIYNNVFAKIPGEQKYQFIMTNVENVSLRNNIFYREQYSGLFGMDANSSIGFSSDYNVLTGARGYGDIISYNDTAYYLTAWVSANLSFPHDQHSLIEQDPLFKSFPAFAAAVDENSSNSRIYIAPNDNTKYNHTFVVGDYVEYNYDQIPRVVTSVGSNYIDVSPSLSYNATAGYYVLDWRNISNLRYDLSLKPDSPAIDAGVDLSSYFTTDKEGVYRSQGTAWDIGAYEYYNSSNPSYSLTISKAGNGSGTVTGNGINCGSICSASATSGTSISLSASPLSGSTFLGWSGACSGTGTCSFTITSDTAVTATFSTNSSSESQNDNGNPGGTGGGGGGGTTATNATNASGTAGTAGGTEQGGQTEGQPTEATGSQGNGNTGKISSSTIVTYMAIFLAIAIVAVVIALIIVVRRARAARLKKEMFGQAATRFNNLTNQEVIR